ncbi:cora-domain-containing protein [Rhodotorula sp. JG-1b]|nr:cora-domain-containing protein [Rhodotorula sp. JG-1b]
MRRKLALFEGAGDDLGVGTASPATLGHANGVAGGAPLSDTKTPLLAERRGAGGYGAAVGPDGRKTGGARPYRFSFYSNSLPTTIHARSLAELPAEGQTFEELFLSATTMRNDRPKTAVMRSDEDAEANTWWLDVTCPTDQEMKTLSKVFGIHPLTTEDIQMEETREKIELFRNYYFVCFRSFEQDPYSPTYLEPLNMYIIVFREGTLSFHFRGTPHPQNVRRRIKQLKDYINVTSDWISYALIDDITDAFGPLIQNIEYEVDSIDELVLILKEAEQSDMLRRIGTCRKKVMGLLRLMGNKADVVKGLSKRCNENWSVAPKSDIGLYLSDIQDHITTSTQNLTHYEKILSRSHSNYLAQISIEMTDANNQINDVLSKLTALGTVLIPMNLVTGLWGMNVNVPGQEAPGLNWFFGILGCLAAFAVVGAFLTYRVSRPFSSLTSPRAILMASSPCSSLSGDEDLALESHRRNIPLVSFYGPSCRLFLRITFEQDVVL